MNTSFETLDFIVFALYGAVILGVGLWVSRDKEGETKSAEDYFLASKSLPWWAIGASLIAANISAEQFIGMSGSGFAVGLAIATYEWMAALTLIIVGKFFLPIFIKKELYTIPEFVEKRYSSQLKTILAVFWIGLYVFVNLASVMYLGGLALQTILGIDMLRCHRTRCLCCSLFALWGFIRSSVDRYHSSSHFTHWRVNHLVFSSQHRFWRRWIYGGAYDRLPCSA